MYPFVLETAIVKGKGENIEFLSSRIPELPVLLINPLIEISTKKIFEGLGYLIKIESIMT